MKPAFSAALIPLWVLTLAGCASRPAAKDVVADTPATLLRTQSVVESVQRTGMPCLLIFEVEGYSLTGFGGGWSEQQGKLLYQGPVAGLPFKFDLASLGRFGLSGTVTVEKSGPDQLILTASAIYTGFHQTQSYTGSGNASKQLSCTISSKTLNKSVRIVAVNISG